MEDRIVRVGRLAALLSTALLVVACTNSPPNAFGDGVWNGAAGNYDFNTRPNWNPPYVPTETATIPASAERHFPYITFSERTTKLAAIEMKGELGLDLAKGKSLTLTKQGLSILGGKETEAIINGDLTGNVTVGPGSAGLNLSGSGVINGNVKQLSGSLNVGAGPNSRILAINGDLLLTQSAAMLDIRLWRDGPAHLLVGGNAVLDQAVLYVQVLDTKQGLGPFEILTTDKGDVRGQFKYSIVVGSGRQEYDARLTYNPKNVMMTLVPKGARRP